jgi:hypothetical protein
MKSYFEQRHAVGWPLRLDACRLRYMLVDGRQSRC